jgi:hypothetical protein
MGVLVGVGVMVGGTCVRVGDGVAWSTIGANTFTGLNLSPPVVPSLFWTAVFLIYPEIGL